MPQWDLNKRYVNDNKGEVGNADVPDGALSAQKIAGTAWTKTNDGAGSGLDADKLDGRHGSFYRNASNINVGTLSTSRYSARSDLASEGYLGNASGDLAQNNGALQSNLNADKLDGQHGTFYRNASNINAGTLKNARYSAYSDLQAEGYLDNNADSDLLTRAQADSRYQAGGSYWSLTGNAGTTPGTHFLGTTDSVSLTLAVNGTAALRLVPTGTFTEAKTANLIGGYGGNWVKAGVYGATIGGGGAYKGCSVPPGDPACWNRVTDYYGTVAGGMDNLAGDEEGFLDDAIYATVGGGAHNTASGVNATVAGGRENTASGFDASVVGGGRGNTASGWFATIAGGSANIANQRGATIGGGEGNHAYGSVATIAGGKSNTVQGGDYSSVLGGYYNTASGPFSAVGGGQNNNAGGGNATVARGDYNAASGGYAAVPGGRFNSAGGDYSFAAGRRAKANHAGAFVWADSTDADFASQRDNQFRVRAGGGVRFDVNGGAWMEVYSTSTSVISTSTGAYLSIGGVWTDSSDRTAKENFSPVDAADVLARVVELPLTTWNHKAQDPSIRSPYEAGGPASCGSGTMTCAGVYDENYTFYPSTCP